jgi:hypothetical protein
MMMIAQRFACLAAAIALAAPAAAAPKVGGLGVAQP